MLGLSRLLCGTVSPGDVLRYGKSSTNLPPHLLHYAREKKPVVVWAVGRRCNLKCRHCYSDSSNVQYEGELGTDECFKVIDDLASFGVPTILFSGGEPLMRRDVFDLVERASSLGIRCVLSTNGTLINEKIAEKIHESGFSYVGVSIDGDEAYHDEFRGVEGSYRAALEGIRFCKNAGVKTGLRFTLHKGNAKYLNHIFNLLESEDISRLCIYHLAYAGRGNSLVDEDLSHEQTKGAMDLIISRTLDFYKRGVEKDILTVDNHADNVYLLNYIKKNQPERADDVEAMLKWNGGNQSGIAIACIDHVGDVHPDQFWQHYTLGNVRQRPFSEIWSDENEPLLEALRNRKPLLKGKCSSCRYVDICNGNLRVRAEAAFGDVWMEDPACYISAEETKG